MVKIAPYGSWDSPVSVADVAAHGGGPQWAGVHAGAAWWAEGRPGENGRVALLCRRGTEPAREVLAAPWNVRNRVHEYGGRPWTILTGAGGDRLVFTHWDDQRLYLLDLDHAGAEPVPISPVPGRRHGFRYAEPVAGPDGAVWCVRETVTGDRRIDIHRDLVAIPADGSAATDPDAVRVLTDSHHFLAGPTVSPDGRHLAWLGWDHPAMPWDGTELCVAEIAGEITAGHTLGPHRVVAGGPAEAVCQVEWDGPDTLLALTDPDGWWNLHRIGLDGTRRNLAPVQAELGGPLWRTGSRWFTPLGEGRFLILRSGHLAVIDETTGTVTDAATDWSTWFATLAAEDGVAVGVAAAPHAARAVLRIDLPDPADPAAVRITEITPQPDGLPDRAYLAIPQERTFADAEGRPIPAYVYPPRNPGFAAPDGEKPPLIVYVHGGPTGSFKPELDLDIAYFTSRGFAVVAVNYGGSTGYGRAFRERLREQWGVVDVADCAGVAAALAEEGGADRDRLVIRGGSAGGWTTAASLTTVDVYRCGTVMYPILDLKGWTAEGGQTHDFESHYVEGLVGPLPAAERRYDERSPSKHPDRLAGPVLLLQGLDDQICPPVQANEFIATLDGSGIPHAYLTFEGEQHGFRKAATIEAALEAELSFYGQVLGFTTPGVPQLGLRR